MSVTINLESRFQNIRNIMVATIFYIQFIGKITHQANKYCSNTGTRLTIRHCCKWGHFFILMEGCLCCWGQKKLPFKILNYFLRHFELRRLKVLETEYKIVDNDTNFRLMIAKNCLFLSFHQSIHLSHIPLNCCMMERRCSLRFWMLLCSSFSLSCSCNTSSWGQTHRTHQI